LDFYLDFLSIHIHSPPEGVLLTKQVTPFAVKLFTLFFDGRPIANTFSKEEVELIALESIDWREYLFMTSLQYHFRRARIGSIDKT